MDACRIAHGTLRSFLNDGSLNDGAGTTNTDLSECRAYEDGIWEDTFQEADWEDHNDWQVGGMLHSDVPRRVACSDNPCLPDGIVSVRYHPVRGRVCKPIF